MMRRKTIIIVLSLLVVGLVFGFVKTIQAQRVPPDQVIPEQKYDLIWEGEAGSEPSLALLEQLLETQAKWEPGEWVQVTIYQFNFPVQPTYLDSDTRLPEETVHKLWYELNAKGLVSSSVDQIWDTEGKLLQEAIALDGQSHHTLTGASFQFLPHKLDLNMGAVLEAKQTYDVPGTARMEEGVLNGKAVYIYITRDTFGVSVAVGEEKAIGARSIAWFDQETGLILRSATYVTLENGEEAQVLDCRYEIQFNADIPSEILGIVTS